MGSSRWSVFGVLSGVYFFLNLATFTSLGVVLYRIVGELHWSMTAAGFSFSLLGIACGLSSPLPALAMRLWGGRVTVVSGTVLLFAGFMIASMANSIAEFYLAMVLVGCGFSFSGNVPGVELIARSFPGTAPRYIGLYLMLGGLGAALGPPIVDAIANYGGWRGHWRVMAALAAALGGISLALPHEGEATHAPTEIGGVRDSIATPQFILVACALTMTMAALTTTSSVLVSHMVKLGATPSEAAYDFGLIALSATLVKGVAGRLCEKLSATTILSSGLLVLAVGCLLLAAADQDWLRVTGAATFGIGFGSTYVAGTVFLIQFFGAVTGARILSMVWMFSTIAAAGPVAAGMIADATGSFALIFRIYAGALVILAAPAFSMGVGGRGGRQGGLLQ